MSKNLVVICKNIEEGHKIIVNEKYIINREKMTKKKNVIQSLLAKSHNPNESAFLMEKCFFFT